MNSRKSLLLVVDVQNGFVTTDTEHVVEPIARLVKDWQKQGGQVVYSRFINLENSPWERLRDWHELKYEPDTTIDARLPAGVQTFKKSTYTAWSPEVQQVCDGYKLTEVYICGIDTNECVLATAIDVFQANLTPFIIKDLCASSAGKKFHDAGILLLERLIGKKQIISSSQLI